MYYLTEKELENKQTLTEEELVSVLDRLRKLIVHGETNGARDYLNILSPILVDHYHKQNINKTLQIITDDRIEPLKKVEPVNPKNHFKASTFFDWSLHQEVCHFCHSTIPVRQVGHGVFIDNSKKPWVKWCEDCATDEHKQHEYYIQYRGTTK